MGLMRVLSKYDGIDLEIMERLSQGSSLTVTRIRDYLEAYSLSEKETLRQYKPESSDTSKALARYVVIAGVNGGRHVIH
ncbi:MAG: hypothetical protein DRH50_06410 [Deltaproteobacteria bacterium]|nr:MAG: hypothetical protein DRH50_06410 [Deltaproteobacteria bacterium]